MPARSVNVFVLNTTDKSLTLVTNSQNLDHGEWSSGRYPPTVIPAGGFGSWASESKGFMTGTEGNVSYTVQDTGKTAVFYWNNPYAGGNSYSAGGPPGFKVTWVGGEGDNATVNYMFMRS